MIVHHFPRPCPPAGWPNLVIHARGHGIEYDEHEAPLSIKCIFQGKETYRAQGIDYTVDPANYLLLNHGRRYSSRIGLNEEAETLSIFFEREFAEQGFRSLAQPADRLLDEPYGGNGLTVNFVESLYPRSPMLSARLDTLRRGSVYGRTDTAWLEERMIEILSSLLCVHSDLLRRIDSLPAVRRVTRLEQYRRLRRARDLIAAEFAADLSLAEIARVACLSPFHLLRLFKAAFGSTPHQYMIRIRLYHARNLLDSTDLSVSQICRGVGYRSLGSFSSLFTRRYGSSPRKLRAQN